MPGLSCLSLSSPCVFEFNPTSYIFFLAIKLSAFLSLLSHSSSAELLGFELQQKASLMVLLASLACFASS